MENKRYIASVSWGKDSLAMLLLLLRERERETSYPLDEVVFFDTGMEFDAIYKTRDQIVPILVELGIKYTELKPDCEFEYLMFEKPVKNRNKTGVHFGYSWCGGRCRWGTSMKLRIIKNYCKGAIQYVGIAADEEQRFLKSQYEGKTLPLVQWGMTEKDCLELCYRNGYQWIESGIRLYDVLDRVSCWCCANKNLKELRNIRMYLPKYWDQLKVLQSKTDRPMKGEGKSVFDLEDRFSKEGVMKK